MDNPYESDELIRSYLLFHYGLEADVWSHVSGPSGAVGFAQRIVTDLLDQSSIDSGSATALDVGCAVGGTCFALAPYCSSVHGIDFSQGFISAARELAAQGRVETVKRVEGDLFDPFVAELPASTPKERVTFAVGDAMNLDQDLSNFDVVVAANLICRLTKPRQFLDRVPSLVKVGGQLLLTTPFTWLEDYTPKESWLSSPDGSFGALEEILKPYFALEQKVDIPFVLREHARKFQYTVALGSRWRRVA